MSGTRIEDYGACFFVTSKLKKPSRNAFVEEETFVEKLKPVECQPLEELVNGLHLDETSDILDGLQNEALSFAREDSEAEIYTSFLTIDVSRFVGAELKQRETLHDLFTPTVEAPYKPSDHLEKHNFDQRKADLAMITKYLNIMPMDSSHWAQNYDVVRDLVKVYLTEKEYSSAYLTDLLDYFVKLRWPYVFTRCLSRISEAFPQVFLHSFDRKINFENPTPEHLDLREHSLEYAVAVVFHLLLVIALEFTETHMASIPACCESGLIKFIFKDLFPKMHGIAWGQNTAREEFLSAAMDIVYNCATSSQSIGYYIENGAIDTLIQFRKETEYVSANRINISVLLALSHLIEDRTNHLIITDPAPLSVLFLCLSECLSSEDHCYGDFTATELLEGVTRIVSHDVNKIMFCDHGNLADLSKVFEDLKTDEEYIAGCRLLWSLCLLPKCRQIVRKRSLSMTKILRKLKRNKKGLVADFADMVLWEILNKYDTPNFKDTAADHIFISAEDEYHNVVSTISEELTSKGYQIWNVSEERKNNDEPIMAKAIRRAAAVIVCVSRKYKQYPECFAAADYAFQIRKPIVPVIVERSFRPDGWLGLLVTSKPWIDFSAPTKFNGALNLLVRQLGERGKGSIDTVNTVVPRNNEFAENGYFDREHEVLQDIATWNNKQVIDWLSEGQLLSSVKEDKLRKLRGVHLIRLNQLRRESPDFYYSALEPQLGFTDVLDMLEFTEALERLTEGNF